ncbi:MAG: methyltransferase [Candidatus Omnitrophica bacterium]|nr:methyltransferase [Candidatus Omnitrophota bacterium]
MLRRWLRDYINQKFVRGNINKNDRSGALHRAWGYIYTSFIEGDYFEFGVYTGDSLIESFKNYKIAKNWIDHQLVSDEFWRRETAKNYSGHVPCFHALDTFAGMPENQEDNPTFAKGNFLAEYDVVSNRCQRNGLKAPQLQLYQGLFKDTQDKLYTNVGDKKAAIINIDCDLYESAKDVLEICGKFIQTGTVLLMDDYNTFSADNNKGERRAFREFSGNSNLVFEPWFSYAYTGQSFLCVEEKK